MIIAKSPVRLSFGGGGTDLPAYYEAHGGAVLSITIDKYFYSVLQEIPGREIEITSSDYQLHQRIADLEQANLKDALRIPKAMLKYFGVKNGVMLQLKSDIPPGSGLGLSGAVATSLARCIGAYVGTPMDQAQVAELATHIELTVLGRPIGMQDQYASAFGGLNFMTFDASGTKVEPLAVSRSRLGELRRHLMLFHTGSSRDSARILEGQRQATKGNDQDVLQALHAVKLTAFRMRDILEGGDILEIGTLLHESWQQKKRFSTSVSNPEIDEYYATAMRCGALGGKITGAGGGGFLLVFAEPDKQERISRELTAKGLQELTFDFEDGGSQITLDQTGRFKATITPEGYLLGMRAVVSRLDKNQIGRIADMLHAAYVADKQVFVMGNGGSAATASHFSSDLAKAVAVNGNRGFRAIPLTDNIPLMTAWGNDVGFEDIFSGQMRNLVNPGDVVIGISGGGMSGNVIKAMELARDRGARTVGLTGFTGGKLKGLVDECFIVPSENYQFIEDVHMMLVHLLTSVVRERLAGE
ncbi:MAG: SIS domain-containing protein [Desulfovibrio sp.]|nr:SIS domain-containing protein [Desulfovibrio sp.]MBI4959614.1 SIS domain-containing protein [Desulfovibrio sp.]